VYLHSQELQHSMRVQRYSFFDLNMIFIGPSVVLSFLICGIISGMTALVYAEFSARMPFSGSGY
jgi:amino acid transporter